MADSLKPTKVGEFQVGHSHAFRPNLVLTAVAVTRYTNDIIEDTDDDADGIYEIKNIDELYRRYFGLELGASWHGKRWNVIGNWTISKSEGNIEYTQGLGTDWDYLPQHEVFHDGYMSYDRRHRINVEGWADLPKKWFFGYDFFWGSGLPFNHLKATQPFGTEFVENRGSQRLPSSYNLDLEGRKTWTVKKVDLTVVGTITNFLNSNLVTGVQERGADNDPSDDLLLLNDWGEPTNWNVPRAYELGFRVTW